MSETEQVSPKHVYPITEPKEFGPSYWLYLENTAANYPKHPNRQDRADAARFLNYFIRNLPCKTPCRDNTYKFFKDYEPDLSSRDGFFKSVVDLHNYVNKETGKKEQYDYKELLAEYNGNGNKSDSSSNSRCRTCSVDHDTPDGNSSVQNGSKVKDIGSSDTGKPDSTGSSNGRDDSDRDRGSDAELQGESAGSKDTLSHEETLRQRLEAFKKVSSDIANDICQKSGVPPPEIIYNECPDGSGNSCAIDKRIYLNPRTYSAGTVFHEVDHYLDRVKNNQVLSDKLNPKADQYADAMIKENFPYDSNTTPDVGKEYVHEKKKDALYNTPKKRGKGKKSIIQQPETPDEWAEARKVVHEVYNINTSPGTSMPVPAAPAPMMATDPYESMPAFKATLAQIQQDEMQEQVKKTMRTQGRGILAHLDPIYEGPATMMGIKAQELNLIHTPQILQKVILTIVESYTTPIASASFSLFTGLAVIIAGILLKDRLPVRDLVFMQMLGALFFWDISKYLNPKRLVDLKDEMDTIGKDVDKNQFSVKHFIETPHKYHHEYVKAMEAQKIADNVVQITEDELAKINEMRVKKSYSTAPSIPLSPSSGSSTTVRTGYTTGREGGSTIKLPPFGSRASDYYI